MHNDAFLTLIHLEIIAIFSNTVTGTHRSPQDNKTNINQILGSTNSYLWWIYIKETVGLSIEQ